MPTLRKPSVKFDLFKHEFNGDVLNEFLSKNNATLYINFHPFDANQKNYLKDYDNINILSSNNDNNNILMKDMNIFITDYSSVFFDFILFDKPIILTPFDYSDYIKFDRNLINEYFDMPSNYAYNWNELIDILINIIELNEDIHMDRRLKLKDKLYPNIRSSGINQTIKLIDNIK